MWSEEDSNWIFNLLFYITIKFVYYQNIVKKYRKIPLNGQQIKHSKPKDKPYKLTNGDG